ncbi:hypothetical protein E2R33_00910 [Rathayibacter toxicus]|uniref:hypothetical protein n=1 Tax=Rathayibacter toxicus TaxID=145458 RepID=UPI001C05AB55|nr:hypothetical protein [Rathayibacter toxicus]QWL27331.1 hypothetical protein E2R33_00910 [Rathayibacter toxicus]
MNQIESLMKELEELRKKNLPALAPTVSESITHDAGEPCWELQGKKIYCQIWDSGGDHWQVGFNRDERIEILELWKGSRGIEHIISNLDRNPFFLVEWRCWRIRLASWVETHDGFQLEWDGDYKKSSDSVWFGKVNVVFSFG